MNNIVQFNFALQSLHLHHMNLGRSIHGATQLILSITSHEETFRYTNNSTVSTCRVLDTINRIARRTLLPRLEWLRYENAQQVTHLLPVVALGPNVFSLFRKQYRQTGVNEIVKGMSPRLTVWRSNRRATAAFKGS